jgi:acyl-CoA synthetase (AMP-forming)/AMP-acid ligase II
LTAGVACVTIPVIEALGPCSDTRTKEEAVLNLGLWATKTADTTPDAIALIEPHLGVQRTFGELAHRVELLAHVLQDVLDAGRGRRVAALGRNSLEFVDLYLAAARSGSVLFPLNWRQSAQLNQLALADCAPTVVFFDSEFADEAALLRDAAPDAQWIEWTPGADSPFEQLIRDAALSRDEMSPLPDPASLIHEPYLAVSTGGTTGIPKSATHSQYTYAGNLLNYLAAQRIDEADVFMMLGQFFHVTGYMPLAYLCMGRPAVITNFEAEETVAVINEHAVTTFFCIATMLPRLVEVLRSKSISTPSVKLVGYGGAPMGQEVIRAASELFDAEMVQIWGMSEFGTGTILGPEAHRRALSGERPELLRSCGRAGLLAEVKIIDLEGRLVPQDRATVGELCYRGPNNMLYYFNKPQETADLVQDGWIHSGDGATWDDEGNVYIADRIKNMIISGGENIFPAEIERVIANMPGVAEVSVVGTPHPEWGEVVRAVVVRSPGSDLDESRIIEVVEAELGSYRKPRVVTFVQSLPMTPTGKIDLRAVRAIS